MTLFIIIIYYFSYPFGWFLCQFQAVSIIVSNELNLGFQFNSSIALSDEAINIAGSPALLGATSAGIGCPVR